MGNQNGKANNKDESLNTARCPQRNRNLRNVKNERHKTSNTDTKQKRISKERGNKNEAMLGQKLSKVSPNDVKTQKPLSISVAKSNRRRPERNLESGPKIKRKRKLKKSQNSEASKNIALQKQCEENMNAARKKQSPKSGNRNPTKAPSPNEVNLISDIFNTVAELESTFLDEKKYERRLRSAYSRQIESMQQLNLSLHMEKQRNQRLMELMSRYDSAETCNFKENNNNAINTLRSVSQERPKLKEIELHDRLNRADRSKWEYQHNFSNAMDTPISPMLMQQRYDELSKSYATCQSELKQKDKLLTLAHCKQEALQAKCDRLTEQFLTAQRKVESLRRKHAHLRRKTLHEQLNKSLDSEESCLEDFENIVERSSQLASKPKLNSANKPENLEISTKTEFLLNGLEKYMLLDEQKSFPKAKAE